MARDFAWTVHPEAEAFVDGLVAEAVRRSPFVAGLAERLRTDTSTRLLDWLDHVAGPVEVGRLAGIGYAEEPTGVWRHPGAQLPAVVPAAGTVLALRVDDCAAAAGAFTAPEPVAGSPLSGLRRVVLSREAGVTVAAVERRSWSAGVVPQELTDDQTVRAVRAWQLWAERRRGFDGAAGVAATVAVAERMVELVGTDLAASYAMELERRYWQRRNTAAVLQHARQDRLGLGWGNHDHHTFRSGRASFRPLLRIMEALGFAFRERFYAGDEGGWGAQVLEHRGCGAVVFADVDLSPEEAGVDFAAMTLPATGELGTVGLWCALHGESVLAAGMHHLEGQFEFDLMRDDMAALGVGHLPPFSDFPHLRQAFTEAEPWPVPAERLDPLVAAGQLDPERAASFAAAGAPGSHLETLARRGGFKGFNQKNVSTTMRATDPRVYNTGRRSENEDFPGWQA
ncbi:MAG: hypothetical protein ACJ73S_27175 [Mycobacteriales bacterium]